MALPHEVLGVAENADEATVNAAFREAAKRFHPDLNNGDMSGVRQLRRLIWAREYLRRHKQRLLNAQSGRPRLPSAGKRRSFRDLYFAFGTICAASILSVAIVFAHWSGAEPRVVVVEKTAKAAMAGLPDAGEAGLKAIRDVQEASYAPPQPEMSMAPEPQSQSRRRHPLQPGVALKRAINHAAFVMSKTFRKLASQ
jgi:uncharacterized iron-regulated membrane protein